MAAGQDQFHRSLSAYLASKALDPAGRRVETNPHLGQRELRPGVSDGKIEELKFSGKGCAISTASASMMTQLVKGKSVTDAVALVDKFRAAMTDGGSAEDMGELGCLSGVKQYPNRVKCATLAWHALKSAVTTGEKVTTE